MHRVHRVLRFIRKVRYPELSSGYTLIMGISAIVISGIVALRVFTQLVADNTRIVPAVIISLIVFYIFSQIYSYVILIGLRVFLKYQNEL